MMMNHTALNTFRDLRLSLAPPVVEVAPSIMRRVVQGLPAITKDLFICGALGAGCYCAIRTFRLYRNWQKHPCEYEEGRQWKLVARSLVGPVAKTVFLPLCPGGTDVDLAWTTTEKGIEKTERGETKLFQPLDMSGLVMRGPFCGLLWNWRVSANRVDDLYVTISVAWTLEEVSEKPRRVFGDWALRRELVDDDVMLFVSRKGEFASAIITSAEEAAVRASLHVNGQKTQPYSIASVLKSLSPRKWKDDPAAAVQSTVLASSMLADFWEAKWPHTQTVSMTPDQALQWVDDDRDDHRKPWKTTGTRCGFEWTTDPDSAPVMGEQNDLVAVHARLDLVRNQMHSMDPEFYAYAAEFVELVSSELTPYSLDMVIECQDGPLQRIRNNLARTFVRITDGFLPVSSMLKKEATTNNGPTRQISTLKAEQNLRISRFTLALSAHLKKTTKWYCAGISPEEVARRMVDICEGQERVLAADVSKMDACKNVAVTCSLLLFLYQKCYGTANEDEVLELFHAEIMAEAKTSNGVKYAAYGSQLSGSATTTNHNTVTNGWMAYAAYRLEGMSPEESYANMGLFVGDDSVSRNTPETIEYVGRILGYTIVGEVIPRGTEVPFLSRYFPHCWMGGLGSYQDVLRLLNKAHLTFSDPSRGQVQLALDKWRGYSDLDPAMSVYTCVHETLCRISGKVGTLRDVGYIQQEYLKAGYAGWPQLTDADSYFAMRTAIPASRYLEWLENVSTFRQFMEGPGFLIGKCNKRKWHTINPFGVGVFPPDRTDDRPPPPEATIYVPDGHKKVHDGVAAAAKINLAIAKKCLGAAKRQHRQKERKPPRERDIFDDASSISSYEFGYTG